ncbi:hypothetical protein A1F94_002443 [Pyrenophora tritici-repentis]|uniref:Uncharacterized protein n=1 Tax=Pyrenophora tritici-repentis TaxID=45151 RepID=A0A834S4Z4_9PLEO|nr:hypothetical protein PtrM4_071880 [Pyrenophora tritici-repentis]KAG9385693.1 hypothetical protein A1F94_002443 [Pyrenophora tritici-repentis]KAI1514694.1 hypothetical protein Ptr86124_006017 [Pyrenophora tritici-repentis]KAI1673095.1 hypothetical protein L13192_03954 [Pyrenophora tritici-repentis]KAI1677072.1 hypothetical protein KJE20_13161 [Pyrenophora tritici-repentis]
MWKLTGSQFDFGHGGEEVTISIMRDRNGHNLFEDYMSVVCIPDAF